MKPTIKANTVRAEQPRAPRPAPTTNSTRSIVGLDPIPPGSTLYGFRDGEGWGEIGPYFMRTENGRWRVHVVIDWLRAQSMCNDRDQWLLDTYAAHRM